MNTGSKMNNFEMSVRSPLTNSNEVTLLEVIQTEKLIYDWQQDFQVDITEEFHGYKEIYLYQCNQTQLKFFAPLDIAGSSHLYEKLQQFDWYYMPDKWEYQIALKNLSNCKKILEVGAGKGDFIRSCLSAGLDIRGIESNEAAVLAAKKQELPLEHLGLVEAASLYHESLDGVCCFQVLEHVPNPKSFIESLIQMLKPKGKLILCVPNAESFLNYKSLLLDMPPHHMHRWSQVSLKALEKLFPIKLEKVEREPLAKYHILTYLAAHANRYRYPINKILFNRYTLSLYEKILSSGLNNSLTGMSLYAQFYRDR